MFKNYLLLGFRNLQKNKVASSVSIISLSAAVGCAIALFLLMQEINTNDDFHKNGDRIFLVGHTVELNEDEHMWGTSPVPLGPALAADFPQIERAVRFANQGAMVQSSGIAFKETVSFADAGFFDMLTFPLLQGQGTALEDLSAVIISSEMAAKYFREQDPLGQELVLNFNDGSVESFIVRGIAEAFPDNASLKFDFLVGYEKRLAAGLASLEDWGAITNATFIQLKQPEDQPFISEQLGRYVPVQNGANDSWQVRSFFLDNIQNPDWISAAGIEDRAMQAPLFWETLMFGLIVVLMLLVSCFNYITVSLGSAGRRLKEIGIRKTVGAEKRQLVIQFLTENLLLCFFALLAGIVFALTVAIPFLNDLVVRQLPYDFFRDNLGFWIFLVALFAFISLVSGAYPAFYISSFRPVAILRGKLKLAEKKGLTRTLIFEQFVLTIITICISTFTASLDITLTDGDWGYDKDRILVIPVFGHEQYTRLRNEALQLHNVRQVAGAEHHIGSSRNRATILLEGTEKEVFHFGVGPSYLTAMGIRVQAGRVFGEEYPADVSHSVVINQAFVQKLGWTDPVGQQLRINGQAFSVIGVIEDFLLAPMAGKTQPAVFGLSDAARYRFLTLQVENGSTDQVVAALKMIWERQFPEVSFEYFHQTEVFDERSMKGVARFIGYLALFALLMSCMGLFGMASQKAAHRIKEVGIRKVMGASAVQVVFLVNRGFLVMLGISTLIATPLFYFVLGSLLTFAPVEIPIGTAPFILSNIIVFLLAVVSLSMQTHKLVKINPADVLRSE